MKKHSDILDMALGLANDLHKVGAMDKATLREIEELAVPQVKQFSAADVRAIREKNRVSQPVFAKYLNVGPSTVSQWEQGKKKPSGPSARLLDVIARKGIQAIA
ncbi:helix-turn-helix domain-containing protein [Rhodobacteraceae bacterium 2376]|uniref:Helix-turn-helix domain-containing protein n=1 Tax=Rhabdonatronobacter sediminivivens TaxID=2743469 RepID=A0A7Z0I1U2_9RHOB|nr:helix-turn-helix domain-containing protein [Rhabdonatronobacter sediminivivens]NYS26385.1 helix-turn-helix domain-containing protein [Rhabdonatronobacter sediminivivens]